MKQDFRQHLTLLIASTSASKFSIVYKPVICSKHFFIELIPEEAPSWSKKIFQKKHTLPSDRIECLRCILSNGPQSDLELIERNVQQNTIINEEDIPQIVKNATPVEGLNNIYRYSHPTRSAIWTS